MNPVVKPIAWKWIILALIPVLVNPWLSVFARQSILELTQDNVNGNYDETAMHVSMLLSFSALVTNALCAPFYFMGFAFLYKLKGRFFPEETIFRPLFFAYVIYSIFSSSIYQLIARGLQYLTPNECHTLILGILVWVQLGIALLLGGSIVWLIFEKKVFASLLGIVALVYVCRNLFSEFINVIIGKMTQDVFVFDIVGLSFFYVFIVFWVFVANQYLMKQREVQAPVTLDE